MRARWMPHLIAAGITVPFAVWIFVSDIRGVLPRYAWLLPLAAAYYLGLRIGRELARGARRSGDGERAGRWGTRGETDRDQPSD